MLQKKKLGPILLSAEIDMSVGTLHICSKLHVFPPLYLLIDLAIPVGITLFEMSSMYM